MIEKARAFVNEGSGEAEPHLQRCAFGAKLSKPARSFAQSYALSSLRDATHKAKL